MPTTRREPNAKRGLIGALLAATVALTGIGSASIPESAEVWVGRHDEDLAGGIDIAKALAVSADGSTVFVTGGSSRAGNLRAVTMAYDAATGVVRWAAGYDGAGGEAIAIAPGGSTLFVAAEVVTIAYDTATGTQRWVAQNTSASSRSIDVAPGAVFVAGPSRGDGPEDYVTVAYDAVSGSRRWVARHNGVGNHTDVPASLRASPDGSKVFVTGSSWHGWDTLDDFVTIAYDSSNGVPVWTARYDGPMHWNDGARSLKISPDSSTVYVTGYGAVQDPLGDFVTIAYDSSNGSQRWIATHLGPDYDISHAIALSPDGSKVYVTGETWADLSGTHVDYLTVSYDAADGSTLWTDALDGPEGLYDVPASLAVSPDGSRLFVTGQMSEPWVVTTYPGTTADYGTVAYDAGTGGLLWVARYNGDGGLRDRPTSIAVSPDGSKVFVTGESHGGVRQEDFLTIAYRVSSPCSSGESERGAVSGAVHEIGEPAAGPLRPHLHGIACDVLAPIEESSN